MFPLFALVDGGLGEWSDWSECSLTCGIGKQGGMGKCDTPKPQDGDRQCDKKEYIHERYCRKRKCGSTETLCARFIGLLDTFVVDRNCFLPFRK